MTMHAAGRPTAPLAFSSSSLHESFTGNQGLMLDEPLLFEVGHREVTGVDLEEVGPFESRLGTQARRATLDLPGLTEPEAMRHYVRLSRQNYAIDLGPYPLGSCTMKHNPRLNEKMARLPGFADLHPLQPRASVAGAIALMTELGTWLMELTGMQAVALSPRAGAHGEFCGMAAIKAALRARGETRDKVLVPLSAHGTNPATAALLGFTVVPVEARGDGTVDVETIKGLLAPNVAAIMLTNPNTSGIFERDIAAIAGAMHAAGAYVYADGANFNALVGKVRPGDLGADAMHINLHKTFSTPHGGGGPGAGPVVLSERLAPFAPPPFVRREPDGRALFVETQEEAGADDAPLGRLTAFHGQFGLFVRALSYMLSHGADGLRQAAEDAVLAANYVKARLKDVMSVAYPARPTMHEVLFSDAFLEGTGVTTLDFAKAMIDEGFHPMTMYFPQVVHGAMLVEPTESESLASLEGLIGAMRFLSQEAKAGHTARFREAPRFAPCKRVDETRAARAPRLVFRQDGQEERGNRSQT